MSDPTLFDEPTPDVHARRSDPRSSHITLDSLGRDGSLKRLIWKCFRFHQLATGFDPALNDTQITTWIEAHTGKRQQRSIIARSRGLMVQDGYLVGVGAARYQGRDLEHYVINPEHPLAQS